MRLVVSVVLLAWGCRAAPKPPTQQVKLEPEMALVEDPEQMRQALVGWLDDGPEEPAITAEPEVNSSSLVLAAATRYATMIGRLPKGTTPVAARFVRDLEGRAGGFVAVFARPGTNLREALRDVVAERDGDAAEESDAKISDRVRRIAQTDRFMTVIVGARSSQQPLLSATHGLPPQLYALLGQHFVAKKLGVARESVKPMRAYVDPAMPRGLNFGIVFEVAGQIALYAVPSRAFPRGVVFPPEVAKEKRTVPAADRTASAQWEAIAVATSGSCHSCVTTYLDGSEASTQSCDGSQCCEWVDGEFQDTGHCAKSCTCECEAIETYDVGKLLRGVPVFFQFQTAATGPFCEGTVRVGCVPTVMGELLAYYDQRGHRALGDRFRAPGSATKLDWRTMLRTFRNDYNTSICHNGATSISVTSMVDGLRDYLADEGVTGTVTRTSFNKNEVSEGWAVITREINAKRPVILSYDANDPDQLGWNFLDGGLHVALITGYEKIEGTGERLIYVDTGWGYGGNEWYSWEVENDTVDLVTVNITQPETDPAFCAIDPDDGMAFDAYYVDPKEHDEDGDVVDSVHYTSDEDEAPNYPIIENLAGLCDVIGGEIETEAHYATTHGCLTPQRAWQIEQSHQQFQTELDDMLDGVDWQTPLP